LSSTDSPPHRSDAGDRPGVAAATPREQPAGLVHALVLALARAAEPGLAGHHIQRIQLYVQALARQLRQTPSYANVWPDDKLEDLVQASALHDIGNSLVPDRILLKPGALTPDEVDSVRSHVVDGRDIIAQIQRSAGGPAGLLERAREITHCHHERWDGQGYPQGLAGDAIPASALVVAIADAYDALTSHRVYRAGVAHDKAMQLLFQERGGQFAPDMVDALIEIQHVFAEIAQRWADSETHLQQQIDYLAKAIAESP
jgi:putative two-component system response regulator